MILFDGINGFAVKHLIFQQSHVGFENIGMLAEILGDILEDFMQLIPCPLYGRPEAVGFPAEFFVFDGVFIDDIHTPGIDQIGLSDADAGRGANTCKYGFPWGVFHHDALLSEPVLDERYHFIQDVGIGRIFDFYPYF